MVIDKISRVSNTVRESGRVGLLIAETKELESKAKLRATEMELQKRLIESVGNKLGFSRTLEEYAKIEGFSARSEDFKDVLENEIVEGAKYPIDWNTEVAKLRRFDRQTLRDEAKPISDAFVVLKEKFTDLPFFQPIVALEPYLNSASLRDGGSGELLEELRDYFEEPVFRLKVAVRSSGPGKRQLHYFLDDPKPQGKSVEIYPVSVMDTSTRLPAQLGAFEIADSPQSRLAISVRQSIEDKSNVYELTCCIILEKILASDVDPLFKAEILQKVSSTLIPSSSVLADHLNPLMNAVSPLEDYSGRDWGKSSDPVVESLRSACEKELAEIRKNVSLPKLWRAKIEPNLASYETLARSLPELKWVGFLAKDEVNGTWICEIPAKFRNSPDGELFIRYVRSGKPVTEVIGNLIDGAPVLKEKPITGKVGRLVFLAIQKRESER